MSKLNCANLFVTFCFCFSTAGTGDWRLAARVHESKNVEDERKERRSLLISFGEGVGTWDSPNDELGVSGKRRSGD